MCLPSFPIVLQLFPTDLKESEQFYEKKNDKEPVTKLMTPATYLGSGPQLKP